MGGELKNLIKVWILAISCLSYCYLIASKFPKGLLRLISLFPVFYLFIILPLSLSSIHFCGVTSFFLVWLANFKLLLFAFDQGPLSSHQLHHKLFHFILVACLPIKFKPNPPQGIVTKPHQQSTQKSYRVPLKSLLLVTKLLLLLSIFYAYESRQHLHPYVVLALYCCHVYLELELVLALCSTPARLLGFALEPQFNEPYLATSLQDFWGRRWNLVVTSILRPTVYDPVQYICRRNKVGHMWPQLLGVVATFIVSGLMHEVIYYYLTRVPPSWEVTWFFVLHGVCVAIEVWLKKKLIKRCGRLPRAVSGALVLIFVAATGLWLFFAQIFRNKLEEKVITEVFFSLAFVRSIMT